MAENLVALRDGAGPSIVFVHPASGLATAFRRLLPYLKHSGAVFALENPEPTGAPPTLSELAVSYWAQLSSPAPDPLVIIGWSFGGSVALELATLAERNARNVAAVVLLDAGAPQLLSPLTSLPLHNLAALFGIAPSELPTEPTPTTDAEILEVLESVLRQTRGMPQIEAADLQPFVAAYRWHHVVTRRPWTFGGHSAPIYLVRARDEEGWGAAPSDLGWSSALGARPIMLSTPGTHHTLMSPEHAPDLARLISTLMVKARQAPSACGDSAS